MAFPTAVNDQITDSVTQSNVKVLGEAPAQATGQLYLAVAQAAGNAAENAVAGQRSANDVAAAVTSRCVKALLGGEA